jgi:hypothetical protein
MQGTYTGLWGDTYPSILSGTWRGSHPGFSGLEQQAQQQLRPETLLLKEKSETQKGLQGIYLGEMQPMLSTNLYSSGWLCCGEKI